MYRTRVFLSDRDAATVATSQRFSLFVRPFQGPSRFGLNCKGGIRSGDGRRECGSTEGGAQSGSVEP